MRSTSKEKGRQMAALREHLLALDPKGGKSVEVPAMYVASRRRVRAISFNDAMIRALRAGRKTETRRPVVDKVASSILRGGSRRLLDARGREITCPFGETGDRLWVRERWARANSQTAPFQYAADVSTERCAKVRWRPTFNMPRIACRMELEILSVRPQRLRALSEKAAIAEGFDAICARSPQSSPQSPRRWFRDLWDSIYRDAPLRWIDNPWVWVIAFSPRPIPTPA